MLVKHGATLLAIGTVCGLIAATGVTRLLQAIAMTNPSVVTLVLSDRYHAEQALALLRLGVADYLARPLDLSRLAYLVDVLTLQARYTGRRPAPAAEPDQPAQAGGSLRSNSRRKTVRSSTCPRPGWDG